MSPLPLLLSLTVSSLFPPDAATNVCPDTPLRITFSAAPTLGSAGTIRVLDVSTGAAVDTIDIASPTATETIGGLAHFKYYPVIITGNQAAIYPRNHALNYNHTYSVTIDPGVFKNVPAVSTPWRFTTQAQPPPAGIAKLTVAADGSGDFSTVQGAVDFIPDGNKAPTTIFIRKGVYTELVNFAGKHDLTFVGQDRGQTIIEYANNARFNSANDRHIYHRGVFLADHCDDLALANLTIRNTTPRGGSQAEAIILNGTPLSRAVLSDLDLYSFQDTLQINGQAYVSDCRIEGDVDFMWGTGPCFFENCHCVGTRDKAFYTQIRNTARNHGYVYHHCSFDGPPGVTNMYLSRIEPRRFPYSEVVLIDCVLGRSVGDIGWMLNGAGDASHLHFWEFNSRDPGGNPIDASKRLPVSRQLKQPDDAATIADYSDPGYVLGGRWARRWPRADATEAGK